MYTIGQFSRICQVSPKALRHYEKLGLLVPFRVDEVIIADLPQHPKKAGDGFATHHLLKIK